jgi:hypothetical protein
MDHVTLGITCGQSNGASSAKPTSVACPAKPAKVAQTRFVGGP